MLIIEFMFDNDKKNPRREHFLFYPDAKLLTFNYFEGLISQSCTSLRISPAGGGLLLR